MTDERASHARWLGQAFRSVDWLIPAYLSMGFLRGLATVIDEAEPEQKLDVFRAVLKIVYTPEYIASLFLYRYRVSEHIRDFSVHIDEAIRAYHAGFRHVAISSMIPVLEGIVRKIAISHGRDVGQGTAGLLREFDSLVEEEISSPIRTEERLLMLEILRDFMRDRFLRNTRRFDGLNQFNRHGILHGVFDDYGEDINFLRIITILDLLCFIINLRSPTISFFAVEITDASDALAKEYLSYNPESNKPFDDPALTDRVRKTFLRSVGPA